MASVNSYRIDSEEIVEADPPANRHIQEEMLKSDSGQAEDEPETMKSSRKLFFSFRMFKKPKQKSFFNSLLCCFRPNAPDANAAQVARELLSKRSCATQAPFKLLLPPVKSNDSNKICMVIDLDETLVHSSFKPVNNADFIVPVNLEGTMHQVYVLKRPFVDEFLERMGQLYECVLFTASLSDYADPVADFLDKWGVFRTRLFRESCVFYNGSYIKDLSKLGRDLKRVVIVDNSPASYFFHKENAVPVASWFEDMGDTELRDLIPFFEKLSTVDNVFTVLQGSNDETQTSGRAIETLPTLSSAHNNIITASSQVLSPIANIPHPPTSKYS